MTILDRYRRWRAARHEAALRAERHRAAESIRKTFAFFGYDTALTMTDDEIEAAAARASAAFASVGLTVDDAHAVLKRLDLPRMEQS